MSLLRSLELSEKLAAQLRDMAEDDAPVALTHEGRVVATLRPKSSPQSPLEPARPLAETECLFHIGQWERDEIAGRFSYCSPELARLHGITVEGYLGRPGNGQDSYDWVHPKDRAAYEAVSRGLREQAAGFDVTYRMIRSDGSVLPVREVATAVIAEEGLHRRSYGFVQDLSGILGDQTQIATQAMLLSQVADLANLGYWIWDEEADRCAYCSESLARLFDMSVEDYVRRFSTLDQVVESLHPDDRETYLEIIEKARREHEPYELTYRVRMVEGQYRHFRDRGAPVLDAAGKLVRCIGTVQDITAEKSVEAQLRETAEGLEAQIEQRTRDIRRATERLAQEISGHKTARRALKESQSQLQAFIDNAPMGIAIKDLSGRYLLVNRGIEELLGVPAEKLLGHSPNDHSRAAFAKQLDDQDKAVLASGRSDLREIRGGPDGDELIYLANKFVISGEAGIPTALGLIAVDITAQKRNEASLRESEKRYRDLFEESPLPMMEEDWSAVKVMLDEVARGGVTDMRAYFEENPSFIESTYAVAKSIGVSKAAVEIYGAKSKEELIGFMTWADSEQDTRKGYVEALLAFYAGEQSYRYEASENTLGIGTIATRVRYVLPAGHREDWSRVLVSIEDITAFRAAEERLRHAQKMEVVGQLTGGVAHDFNNLLAIIQGNAELLAERAIDCESLINPIVHAAVRGGELTHGLLAFSRRQPLVPQPVDLMGLMSGMLELLRRTLGETIEIGFSAAPGLWRALADPGQLESALLNLALNARDAMPNGGALSIACENARAGQHNWPEDQDIAEGDYVMVSVSDVGCGMTADVREHAFEPFFTTKEVRQGSGLGLSMVYGFAKQSGGHVTLESNVGQGTKVQVYLPRAEAPAPSVSTKEKPNVVVGSGELILVIEDEPEVRSLTKRMLETMGFEVIAVADAAAARDILASGPAISLLLSDVVLPGGTSGPAFVEELRERDPSLPVIFMSGYPADDKGSDSVIETEQTLLHKPFQMSALAKAVAEAMN